MHPLVHITISTLASLVPSQFIKVSALYLCAVSLGVILRWALSSMNWTRQRLDSTTQPGESRQRPRTWNPIQFDYPPIAPFPSDPVGMPPIPYRPFRDGEYHVTMGIRSMNWNDWIEIDSEYIPYQLIRKQRILKRGSKVIRVLPDTPGLVQSGGEASIELVHELAEYLSRRFPTMFKIIRYQSDILPDFTGWYGLPPIKSIEVLPLNVNFELPLHTNDGPDAAVRALEVASSIVQEDLALMIEGSDGRYYFQAGAILIPGSWRIQDKIGLPLDEIHTSGNVPRYQEKLERSMERFFQKLDVTKPVVRNNYYCQVIQPLVSPGSEGDPTDPEELAWAETSHGPEDSFQGADKIRDATHPNPSPSLIRLRSERQTLRRLPRTGAILFTIRTYLTPVESLKDEPGVAKRLAGALRGWGSDIAEYKGKDRGGWWDVLLEFLDECAQEQAREGVDIDVKHKYPF